MDLNLQKKDWWNYIEVDLQELLVEAEFLVDVVKSWGGDLPAGKHVFHDYAFVVFPVAKAYEGFLKKLFLDLGFITNEDYKGKRFRIGKALNPFLDAKYRDNESVYDRISKECNNGKELADTLWTAWIEGRNLVFHWFPEEKKVISFEESQQKIMLIIDAMDKAFAGCTLNTNGQN